MAFDKLENLLAKIEKDIRGPNYWLRFDVRGKQGHIVGRRKEFTYSLYPEASEESIIIKPCTFLTLSNKLSECFSYDAKEKIIGFKYSQKVAKELSAIMGGIGIEYFELSCQEQDVHPTPYIFWGFWFLVLDRQNNVGLGFSGGACD